MIRAGIFICLFLLNATFSFSQTTYYVSASQGNDTNSGTSETTPWKTITKVNNMTFQPGDKILFKKNDIWVGEALSIISSGTSSNRIVFTAYGTGAKPIITLREELPGWNRPENWTSQGSNRWSFNIGSDAFPIMRMWFDGSEFAGAVSLNGDNFDNLSGLPTTYGVNSTHRFFHGKWENPAKLYVYGTVNPALYYSSIEYPGKIRNFKEPTYQTITLTGDYVILDELDVRGGMYSPIMIRGGDYDIVRNCNVGQSSNFAGIYITANGSDYSNNNIIHGNWLETGKTWKQNFYNAATPYGVVMGTGAEYNEIYDNHIINFEMGIFIVSLNTGSAKYNIIHDNEITAPNLAYSKGMQIGSYIDANDGYVNTEIYNNYIHDVRANGIQINSYGNKVYFNIFYNIMFSQNEHADKLNSGFGIQLTDGEYGVGAPKDNFIFNNTFFNCKEVAIFTESRINYFYNNLFADNYTGLQILESIGVPSIWKNNLFFYTGATSDSKMVEIKNFESFTIGNFNNIFTNASGNIQHVGSLSNLINSDFNLSNSSPALNGGTDISTLVPEGFTDRFGNVINRTKPDIGAVQSSVFTGDTSQPTLIGATPLDSTRLLLTFSEPLNPSGVTSVSNYSISNGIVVYSAELSSDPTKITLTTSAHIYGQNYFLSVFNLQDLTGNVISYSSNSVYYQRIFDLLSVGWINKLPIVQASASNTTDIITAPDKTIDGLYYSNGGNPDSRWAAMPLPQWLIYDFGVAKQISKTRISFYEFQNGRIYNYNLTISNDAVNWVYIVNNATSSNSEWTENIFNPIIARFLKLEIIGNNQNTWATVWEMEIWGTSSLQPPLQVKSKIFLQGAYEYNQMRTILGGSKFIPLNQPYNIAPWNYNGYESVSSIPTEVVDWVLVEVRSDVSSSSVVSKRAAFVRSDGSIVDLDGRNYVSFWGVNSGDYYIIIHHRNHLSVMSAGKVALTESSILYDFTFSNSSAYGNELADLGNGAYGMYSGDGDANETVNVLDYGIVGNKLFQIGYLAGDLDLNGTVNVLDYGKANQNLLKVSKVP